MNVYSSDKSRVLNKDKQKLLASFLDQGYQLYPISDPQPPIHTSGQDLLGSLS